MTVIHPQGSYKSISQTATRTTVRSAQRCAAIWISGVFITIAAFVGLLSGALGEITFALDLSAGILYIVAGRVAENDRKAKRFPPRGSGSGGERGLGWFFFLAALLLVTALGYGFAHMPTKQ
jgi:hypothetical protein